MRVLGIETSGEVAGVAVVDAGGLRAELRFRHEMQLSRYLAARIPEVTALAGMQIADLEGIAVGVGPGSFTGLRIGVTVAKSLAFARELPVAGIGTLPALASENPSAGRSLLCSILSASPVDVYAALFQWVDGRPEPRAEEMLLSARDLAVKLAQSPLEVVMVGQPGPHRQQLQEALGPRLAMLGEDATPRPSTIARLGRERLLAGQPDPFHALAPRYLRASTAEVRRKEAACRAS